MRAPRQKEDSSASAVTHGSPVTSPRSRRRLRLQRQGSSPALPQEPGRPGAEEGARTEEERERWATGSVPGFSPVCLTALASSRGPESGTVPEPAKSCQRCYRIHVARSGAFSPPPGCLLCRPSLSSTHTTNSKHVRTLQFCKAQTGSLSPLRCWVREIASSTLDFKK